MHFATKGDNSLLQSYQWLAGWPSLCCSLQCWLHLESCGSKREVMAHNGSNLLFTLVCHPILQMHARVKKSNDREILCLKPIIISHYHNVWICTSSESLTCFSQDWWFVRTVAEDSDHVLPHIRCLLTLRWPNHHSESPFTFQRGNVALHQRGRRTAAVVVKESPKLLDKNQCNAVLQLWQLQRRLLVRTPIFCQHFSDNREWI